MGTHGLQRYDTKDFWNFLSISGYVDAHDFWSSLSNISEGTTFDHMVDYLTSEGYTGSPHDKLRQFLEAQVGQIGSVYDMATVFYQDIFSVGTFQIRDDDGNIVTDDDSNIVTD